MKLDAATAVAVNTPTVISGTPDNPRAVFATPAMVFATLKVVIFPIEEIILVVVTMPRFKLGFNL